jgi:uncharacterized protein YegP (UPF0339 family)
VAGNGENVLRSQGYTTLASAISGVESVLENGSDTRNFDLLRAKNGDFYFNVKAANGQVIGSSQLFASKTSAERSARTVRALVRISRQGLSTGEASRRETFELFTGEDGQSYFRLRAGNGEILLGSEGYTSKAGVLNGIASVKTNGAHAERFDVFELANGEWAVHLVASNGEIIARCESYTTKADAERAVSRMTEILSGYVTITE